MGRTRNFAEVIQAMLGADPELAAAVEAEVAASRDNRRLCPTCDGGSDEYYNTPGKERDAPCPTCNGNGYVAASFDRE